MNDDENYIEVRAHAEYHQTVQIAKLYFKRFKIKCNPVPIRDCWNNVWNNLNTNFQKGYNMPLYKFSLTHLPMMQ